MERESTSFIFSIVRLPPVASGLYMTGLALTMIERFMPERLQESGRFGYVGLMTACAAADLPDLFSVREE